MRPAPSSPASRLVAVLSLLAAAACSRDLDLPARNTLAFANAFPSAAPREALTLVVTGGSRPYTFSFSDGAAASGPDATLDPATGAYVAGSLGPAIDVVRVRDSSGGARDVRVSVGPPLQVAAASAFVAPGGKAAFVASGGKPPYHLEILSGPGAIDPASPTNYLAPPSGGCGGTVAPPAEVTLRLLDATSVTSVALAVTVGRGLDLFPAVGTGAVAPYEQIAFVASGGQPPYEFSMAPGPIPSGGPGVDPGRGTYVAGPAGDVVDEVVVTDANLEQRCFGVAVGPPLSLALSTTDVRPGRELRLVASGGRAPYRFSFTAKGNRSRGTLDPVTGAYVPGLNALATDLVEVSDATGAPALGPFAIPVGPLQVATGPSPYGCATGRDASELSDVFAFNGSVTLVRPVSGSVPQVASYGVSASATEHVVADLDGDGFADVAYLVQDPSYGSVAVGTLLARPGGVLEVGPTFTPAAGTPVRLAGAQGSARLFVAVTNTSPWCAGGGRGVLSLELDPQGAFTASCAAAFAGTPFDFAAGDFDGDGNDDLAYTLVGTTDRVFFRMGAGPTPYATAREVLVTPAPWRVDRLAGTVAQRMVALRPDGQAASDLVAVAIDAPYSSTADYRTGLAVFRGGAGGPTLQQVGLFQPGADGAAFNVLGIAALGLGPGGHPRIAAWNGTDGAAVLLDYPFTSNPPAPSAASPAPRGYRVGCMTGGDLDGDGIEDLVILPRDSGPQSDVLGGEGDGTFGRRPRFRSQSSSRPAGDLDGDGLLDWAGTSPSGGLEVLFSSDGQIAVGPETPLTGQLLGAPFGDWDGDGTADVMARVGATGLYFYRGVPGTPGRFDPPQAVSVRTATGVPYPVTTVMFYAANLGGGARGVGPDLLAYLREGSQVRLAALRFGDATHAVVGLAAPIATNDWVAADLDGDGVDDVVSYSTTVYAALVKPGDDPATNPTWPFRPWTSVVPEVPYSYPLLAGSVPVPGAVPSRSRIFAVVPAGIAAVDGAGGVLAATVTPLPAGVFDQVGAAGMGDVTGDGLPDLVVARAPPLPWLVFPGTADGLVSGTPRDDLSFSPGLGGFFAIVPGTSGAADVVVEVPGALLVLRNDGFGHFH